MMSLNRFDIDKMLKKCFNPREGEMIGEIFLTKRNEFKSSNEYFEAIEKLMKRVSVIGFYVVFPQLIRYMKD